MPLPALPTILMTVGKAAKAVGVAGAAYGTYKTGKAGLTVRNAKKRHDYNIERFETSNQKTSNVMDSLGKLELEILDSFNEFSDIIEKIHNKPEFKAYDKEGFPLPEYNPEELKKVSVGAGALLGGLGGAALGTAGGFAASSATTSAVIAFGTASTGTAISSLKGIALTKATLAAIGGGSVAKGGGGIALGTKILSATSASAGILVGGIVFGVTGNALSDKADKTWEQVYESERQVNEICAYLATLATLAKRYSLALTEVKDIYTKYLNGLKTIVELLGKTDWTQFTPAEILLTENTILLVGLLYKMCSVPMVKQSGSDKQINKANSAEVKECMDNAEKLLEECGLKVNSKGETVSELKLYDVMSVEHEKCNFRVTAKVSYSPVRVGYRYALLVSA